MSDKTSEYECHRCGTLLDKDGYCSECDAYDDDKECPECGEILDYDGICPNHCGEDEEDIDEIDDDFYDEDDEE